MKRICRGLLTVFLLLVFTPCVLPAEQVSAPSSCCTTAGDANGDGIVSIGDITFIIARIFTPGAQQSPCCEQADADGSSKVNILDATYLIRTIFSSGPAPVCGTGVSQC